MFEVVITEIQGSFQPGDADGLKKVESYRQTVDALDIRAVMAAVNHRPRKARTPKVDK